MATSDLYKMGLIMNMTPFTIRVKAAVLQYAATLPLGGAASEAKNFAIHILRNPQFEEISMVALVATDPTVLAQATFVDGVVSVDEVTDAAIKAVVAARWSLVATKYPVTPVA